MRPERIDQVLHILAYNDAIGNHVLAMRGVLRDAGFESEIYSGEVHPELKGETRSLEHLPDTAARGTWLLFHHSIGSRVADVVARRSEPLVVDYHNITPPELIDGWAPRVVGELEEGIEQLERIAPKAFFGIAHSKFSEGELRGYGCGRTRVAPPLFPKTSSEPDPWVADGIRREKKGGGSDWLFVGRISPHKAQHDLVKALACYREAYDPLARLHLIGTSLGEDYGRALERYAERLGVADGVRMPGTVTPEVLSAYYEESDVFVCASDHEGFCVPLVEAMTRGMRVVAFDAAAVGETVASGGVVLDEKSPLLMATAVNRVLGDKELSERLSQQAKQRAAELSMPASAVLMRSAIEEAVAVADELGIS
jgi:L-malate glycosyltransferase